MADTVPSPGSPPSQHNNDTDSGDAVSSADPKFVDDDIAAPVRADVSSRPNPSPAPDAPSTPDLSAVYEDNQATAEIIKPQARLAVSTNQNTKPDEPVIVQLVSNLVAGLLSPIAAGDTPDSPPADVAGVAMLALARREWDGTSTTDKPTIGGIAQADKSSLTVTPLASSTAPSYDDVFTVPTSFVQEIFKLGMSLIRFAGHLIGLDNPLAVLTDILAAPEPPWYWTLGLDVERSEINGMPVWTMKDPASTSDEQIVALHGGGYRIEVINPNWFTYANMARQTGAAVVVPIYPLTPTGTASEVVPTTADLLAGLVREHGSENVSVLGESAGGGLGLAATQYIVAHRDRYTSGDGKLLQVSRMVLVSPWLDVSMSDPQSQIINDPVADFGYLQDAGREWAGDLDPADPLASPLFGSLEDLPFITAYSGSADLLSPDTVRLRERALAEGIPMDFVLQKGGVHGWAGFFFLPDAIAVTPDIYEQLIGPDTVPPVGREPTLGG